MVRAGPHRPVRELAPALLLGLVGVRPEPWEPPPWLLVHQREAARRLAAALRVFGGALLCDAVGLGKSFVAMALAGRYAAATLVVPAALRPQWRDLTARYGLAPRLVTHEALSRSASFAPTPLLVIDEAHRFRDPRTRRYDALCRQVRDADVLLVTATPVVNRAADLAALLRLFLSDSALAPLGIPSLEAAAEDGALEELTHAVAPLLVARSSDTAQPDTPLPAMRGGRVMRPAPVEPSLLAPLLRAIRALRFPTFGPDAAPLLRRHLAARLASSPEAGAESVRRHLAYLARAREAARRGRRLGRAAARALFGPDDAGQLELTFDMAPPLRAATRTMDAERRRLEELATLLRRTNTNPKAAACLALLRRRAGGGRKTIVFTAARATARALAAALGWQRVVVVAGGRAEIASGALAPAEAFAWFAPRAQGRPARPGGTLELDTLIATDVASEGLNLQDADAVVHYDLPWTPLALEQRAGRVRRLNSTHRLVRAWWYAPPRVLERYLGATARIARKATLQLALGTAQTAAVGRTSVVGGALDRRERLVADPCREVAGHAVTDATHPALAVVRWRGRRGDVFQILARHTPGLPLDAVERVLAARDGPPGAGARDFAWAARELRARAAAADRPPRHVAARVLAGRIATLARAAARARAARALGVLDRVLAAVHAGLCVGAERELRDLLAAAHPAPDRLAAWHRRWVPRHPGLQDPDVEASVMPGAGAG